MMLFLITSNWKTVTDDLQKKIYGLRQKKEHRTGCDALAV